MVPVPLQKLRALDPFSDTAGLLFSSIAATCFLVCAMIWNAPGRLHQFFLMAACLQMGVVVVASLRQAGILPRPRETVVENYRLTR